MYNGRTYDVMIIDDLIIIDGISRSMRRLNNRMMVETFMSRCAYECSQEVVLAKPKNLPYGPQKRGRKGKVKKY